MFLSISLCNFLLSLSVPLTYCILLSSLRFITLLPNASHMFPIANPDSTTIMTLSKEEHSKVHLSKKSSMAKFN